MTFAQILNQEMYLNTPQTFLIALGVLLAVFLIGQLLLWPLLRYLKKLVKITKSKLDDKLLELVYSSKAGLLLMLGFYIALNFIRTIPQADKLVHSLFVILWVYYAIRLMQVILEHLAFVYMHRNGIDTTSYEAMRNWIHRVVYLILWISGILFVLYLFGFNVTNVVASLGVGGIVLAFASQQILSDWFSSFFIYFSKPFRIGDYIKLDGEEGTVKHISLKNTHIETKKGDELIVPNNKIMSSSLHNYQNMKRRRIEFDLGLEYGTPTAKMKKITTEIQKIIEAEEGTEFFRASFKDFGESAFLIRVIYFLEIKEYANYLDTNERVNYKIRELLERLKVNLAYPTKSVYLKK